MQGRGLGGFDWLGGFGWMCRLMGLAALGLLTTALVGGQGRASGRTPVSGQAPVETPAVTVNTPGNAFTVERGGAAGGGVSVDDVPGGRRFRAPAFTKITLRAPLRLALDRAIPRVERLAVHFRTHPAAVGPTLRRVELWNGAYVDFRVDTLIQGDYMTKNLTRPAVVANVWSFAPRNVNARSFLRLEVQFPGGIDSAVDPGEFVLAGVEADFSSKPDGAPQQTRRR
jgi:hypothetical protein